MEMPRRRSLPELLCINNVEEWSDELWGSLCPSGLRGEAHGCKVANKQGSFDMLGKDIGTVLLARDFLNGDVTVSDLLLYP